jgi:hypothetical protein
MDAVAACHLEGEWSENTKNKFYSFHAKTGEVLNWWPSTGTVQFQGNRPEVETVPKYHVVVEQPDPNSWRWGWEIYCNDQPLGVRLRGASYLSKQGAQRAGASALRKFLAGLAREQGA